MKYSLILFLIVIINSTAFSQSAMRLPHESSKEAEMRTLKLSNRTNFKSAKAQSYSEKRVSYEELNLDDLKKFNSVEEMTTHFNAVRDIKFLNDKQSKGKRRSSWMYPDDGCWIRAQLMNFNLQKMINTKLNKIFIFGNLKVHTNYSPSGSVRWWYHVVPIAKVEGTPYVFDPAIDNSKPLTLKEWTLRQVSGLSKAKFKICHADTYGPHASCNTPSKPDYKNVQYHQVEYLREERRRLRVLGFDAEDYLTDNPPWL